MAPGPPDKKGNPDHRGPPDTPYDKGREIEFTKQFLSSGIHFKYRLVPPKVNDQKEKNEASALQNIWIQWKLNNRANQWYLE
jgi:hypothetical protein